MPRKIHGLTHIDPIIQEAMCSNCGHVSIKKNGHGPQGNQQWKCCGTLNYQEHRLLDLDVEEKTAWCKKCQRRVDFIGSGSKRIKCGPDSRQRASNRRISNAEQIRESHAEWRRNNAGKLKENHYRRTFGISFEEVKKKFHRQNGRCAICDRGLSLIREAPRDVRAHLDHDHETGLVRDLLCQHCNTGLGQFFDSPEKLEAAANYLRRHSKL